MSCNHVWRDTPLPVPKESKSDLLASIVDSGTSGWWLRGEEFDLAQKLFDEGLIRYCDKCGPGMAVFATAQSGNMKNSEHPVPKVESGADANNAQQRKGKICPSCKGTGMEHWKSGAVSTCGGCKGTGRLSPVA